MAALNTPSSSPIEALLTEIKERVDQHLTRYFEQKRGRAQELSAPSVEMVDALEDFTMRGGKRTRPAVLVAGHMAVSEHTDLDALLDPCASLELLQSYLLVHDDWMDQDDERRGGITLHKLWGDRLNDLHLGASLAVLAGDLGNGFAIELMARAPVAEARRAAAMQVFWEMQQDVVWGQALDLIAFPDVNLIQRLKTGSYSVKGPLLLGAVLGGATPKQREALERYAEPVGLAFQVRDDVLGTFGDPAKTGKPAGNDLRAGKRTVLVDEAEKRLSASEFAPIRSVLSKQDSSDAAVAAAMALIERCGARTAVEERIAQLFAAAQAVLKDAGFTAQGGQRLEQLAQKFAYRDR